MDSEATDSHGPLPSIVPRRRSSVRHFNGWERGNNDWDGLRRDKELWFDDGDCLVHLYTLGGSRRGPSLRLRYSDVEALSSEYLTEQCLHIKDTSTPLGSDDGASDSGYASSMASRSESKQCEIYIPTPANLTREQAYSYHLTTRNFFAYATSKPVVGQKLGVSLADLLDRIREWQPKSAALTTFTKYCQAQGYQDMANNADCAIACLTLAEHAGLKSLWTEAFVHCAGMHEQLDRSAEYDALSNTTKALIHRASLEMDLHIARVTRALGTFLEDELGPESLGLSKPARDHLDRFRSCLHNYYVEKLGYYPPNEDGPWNKRLWTKMYHAFHTLYEYLVDAESTTDPTYSRAVTGGVCVVQNVQAFDQRHGYAPLPHPLPLLPTMAAGKAEVQKGLRSFRLGRQESGAGDRASDKEALAQATNSENEEIMAWELVQEYQRFEQQRLEEKITTVEARKVRWLLIYGALQMLISITRAPKEVRDPETPTYPMCVLTVGCPRFEDSPLVQRNPEMDLAVTALTPTQHSANEKEDRMSIHPDCEAENAEGYFSAQTLSQQPSQVGLDTTLPPLRITTQISRTASLRSSVHSGVHALHRSFVGSLGRRSSPRKTMTNSRPLSKSSSFCEILVEGYGNGVAGEEDAPHHQATASPEPSSATANTNNSFIDFDFGLEEVNEEPMLEDSQLDGLHDLPVSPCSLTDNERSSSDSCLSSMASNTDSTRSSMYIGTYDSPATELSFSDIDMAKRNSDVGLSATLSVSPTNITRPGNWKSHSWQQKHLNFGHLEYGVRSTCYSVNAGCYIPTGQPLVLPLSKYHLSRVGSAESLQLSASLQGPDKGRQITETEEEETRGRQRSRTLV